MTLARKAKPARRDKGTGTLRAMMSADGLTVTRYQARAPHPTETTISKGPGGRLYERPRVITRSFQTKQDAEAWLANPTFEPVPSKAVTPAEVAPVVHGKPHSFEAYARQWLARGGVYGELRPRTRDLYRSQLERFLIPTFGRLPLRSITPDDVRAWYASMDPAHPRQRAQVYGLLSVILRTAVEDRELDVSPCTIRQRTPKKAPQGAGESGVTITDAELDAMAEAMPEHLQLVVLLAGYCGLRQGEVLALQRRDIDVDAGTITVARAITRTSEGVVEGPPKTAAGTRIVPIPPHLIPVTHAHLDTYVRPEPDALMFTTATGRHLTSTSLYRFWYPARESVGHPGLRFHDLRHVAASRLGRLGAGPSDIARFLGHEDRGITALQVYVHADHEKQRELAALVSSAYEATQSAKVTPIRGRARG